MGWSWQDLMSTPTHVVGEAMDLMVETTEEQAREDAAAELRLRALKSAKARGR